MHVSRRNAAPMRKTRLAHMQRVDALGRIVGGVAHDFNNIVQAMRGGAARVAKRADDPEEVRRIAGMIDAAAERGARLIERMLAFARREPDPDGPVRSCRGVVGNRRPSDTPRSARRTGLDMEIEPDLPPVTGDALPNSKPRWSISCSMPATPCPKAAPIRLVAQRELASADADTIEGGTMPGRIVAIAVADAGAGHG